MSRVVCWLFGHRYEPVWTRLNNDPPQDTGWRVCARCWAATPPGSKRSDEGQ